MSRLHGNLLAPDLNAKLAAPLKALALLAASLLVLGCGERPLEPDDPTPGAPDFTIQSYNVELNSANERSSLEAVGAADADIVCLQEVTTDWEAALRQRYRTQYPYMLFQTRGDAGGLAVLSHYPLTDSGLQPGPGGWHPAWHLQVDSPAGPLQVLDVHLRSLLSGSGGAVRSYLSTSDDHLAEISDFAGNCNGDYPTIVLGDFNEGPEGSAVRYLERLGFHNILPLYHPGQPTWRQGSIADQLQETFDHILFDDNLRPLNAWVERSGASDHLPVLAHFEPYTW